MLNFAASLAFYGAMTMILVVAPLLFAYCVYCMWQNWRLERHLNQLRTRLGVCPTSDKAPWGRRWGR